MHFRAFKLCILILVDVGFPGNLQWFLGLGLGGSLGVG